MVAGGEELRASHEALARHDWAAARALLESLPTATPPAEAERLDLLAEALWWLGSIDDCIDARERAYAIFEEQGLGREAAQCAVWLYEHHCFKSRPSIGGGWLRRARRCLDGAGDCVAWGNLLLREAEMSHGAGELDRAVDNTTIALALGRKLRSADLEAEGLQTMGRLLIDQGRHRDGLAHLDEAMLLAVEGRLGPYAAGKVYCSLVGACEDLGDLRRAAEWTEATARWSEQNPSALFPGLCRVKRAEVLGWAGDWARAEQEARLACEELDAVKVGSAAAAWVEIGEIRRRLGDLDGAEEAFRHVQELCCTPSAGLALLRLAQGRLDTAVAIITRAIDEQTWSALARARLLPAKVQVSVAAGDLEAARSAADELDAIAERYESPMFLAAAALARGRFRLAAGDAAGAGAALRGAIERWHELDVPYEKATAQVLLGQACRQAGDEDGAVAFFAAAASVFERLGAVIDARQTRDLHRRTVLPGGLTEREAEVLRLLAGGGTNKEIAAQLHLSDKTIARHVSNIFVKIGVSTRSAATAFAFEHHIVGSYASKDSGKPTR